MFTMLVSIMTYFIFLFIWSVSEVLICIYILRNSKKYKMNSVLWVAVGLVFNILGLSAYFIARRKTFEKKCPVCMCETEKKSAYCSQCGAELKNVRPRLRFLPKLIIGILTFISLCHVISLFFTYLHSL